MSNLESILKKPITAEEKSSLSHVISELLRNNISRLIIIDEKSSPVGIISEKDIGLFLLEDDTEKNLDQIPVSQIMNDITSVNDSMTVEQCARLMLEKGIGSLGVSSNSKGLVGIITKTDIAQHYAKNSEGKHKVGDTMTISYIYMNSDDTLSDVVSRMIDEKISRIFIKNKNGEPEGILTFRDLFHVALEQGNSDSVLDNSEQTMSIIFTRKGFLSDSGFGKTILAKDIMTKTFEFVDFDEDISVACDTMAQNRVNGVGVKIDGNLGGVISKTDVLKAIYLDSQSE